MGALAGLADCSACTIANAPGTVGEHEPMLRVVRRVATTLWSLAAMPAAITERERMSERRGQENCRSASVAHVRMRAINTMRRG
jgi:hypothetical protein